MRFGCLGGSDCLGAHFERNQALPDEQIPPPPGPGPDPAGIQGAQLPPQQPVPPPGAPGWPPPPGAGWAAPGPASWQLPAQQPARSRSRRAAWLAGSAVLVVTALVAGSIGFVIGDQHSRLQAAAAGASAVTSGCGTGSAPDPSATSPAGAALLARLLPVPAGASPDTAEKQGEFSLNDYLHALYPDHPDEKLRLAARCFQVAVHREWSLPSGATASIWLVQFGGPADARSYALAAEEAPSALGTSTVKLRVTGVADGVDIAERSLDQFGNTRSQLIGDRGSVTILINLFVPASLDNALAARVLQQQDKRLR